jgi:hypothetical protein
LVWNINFFVTVDDAEKVIQAAADLIPGVDSVIPPGTLRT